MDDLTFEERRDAFVKEALEGFYRANSDEAAMRLMELERKSMADKQLVPHSGQSVKTVYVEVPAKHKAKREFRMPNFDPYWPLVWFVLSGGFCALMLILTPAAMIWGVLFIISSIMAFCSGLICAIDFLDAIM